jgi:hypothetical protein
VKHSDQLDAGQTSYVSSAQVGPGFYYVRVGVFRPFDCTTCAFVEWSNILTITIPPDPPPPPPPPPPAPPADRVKPFALAGGPSRQDIDRLFIRASMSEAGAVTATGTVNVPRGASKVYRFKPATRVVAANVPVQLPLKLASKARKSAH